MAEYTLIEEEPNYRLIDDSIKSDGTFIGNIAAGARLGGADFKNRLAQLLSSAGQKGANSVEAHLSGMEIPSEDYSQYNKELDAEILANRQNPVMRTAGGKVGYIAAKSAPAVAATFVPGGQTLAGSMAIGAGLGAMEPVINDESTLKNAAFGAGGGAAGYGGGKLIGYMAEKGANALSKALMQPKQDILESAITSGYVVNPTAVNPSMTNKILESFAGKASLGQEAAARNQGVSTSLAKKALGVSEETPLTGELLAGIRKEAAAPYQEIASLSKKAADNLEKLKQARSDANAYFTHYNVSKDPSSLSAAREARQLATNLESAIEKEAVNAGREYLVPALQEARKEIAKTYTVGRALTPNGDIDARVLGAMLRKGQPLTDELKEIAKFQQAFPNLAREGAKVPTSGVSKLDAVLASGLGGAGYAIDGKQGATIGALAPFVLPPAARGVALSKMLQGGLKYPGIESGKVIEALANPYSRALLQGLTIQAAPTDRTQP